MNAMLNIQVRVTNIGQAELAQLRSAITEMGAAAGKTTTQLTTMNASLTKTFDELEKRGRTLQSVGRQLENTITIPLAAAAAAGVFFGNQQEKAFVQLKNTYDVFGQSVQQRTKDLDLLNQAARLLSDTFGVSKAKVLEIESAFAAAGSTGGDLALRTRNALELMTLGFNDQSAAVKALIAIESLYGTTADQMKSKIEQLIVTTRIAPTTVQNLTDGIVKAGGAAITAGVDFEHLTALIAGFSKYGVDGTRAGQSLTTMFSNLLAPTKQGAEIMGALGINVGSASWQMENGAQRIETMAAAFAKLTGPQQDVVSRTIGTRFQIAAFGDIMRDVNNQMGTYHSTLSILSNKTKTHQEAERELQNVLKSNPQMWKQIIVEGENLLADVFVPIIPYVLGFAHALTGLVQGFTSLNPNIQQFILIGLAALAILPLIARYLGAAEIIIGFVGKAFLKMGGEATVAEKSALSISESFQSALRTGIQPLINGLERLGAVFQKTAAEATTASEEMAIAPEQIAIANESAATMTYEGWAAAYAGITQDAGLVAAVQEEAAAQNVLFHAATYAAMEEQEAAALAFAQEQAAAWAVIEHEKAIAAQVAAAQSAAAWDAYYGNDLAAASTRATVEGTLDASLVVSADEAAAARAAAYDAAAVAEATSVSLATAEMVAADEAAAAAAAASAVAMEGSFAIIPVAIVAGLAAAVLAVVYNFSTIKRWIGDFAQWLVEEMGNAWNALPHIVASAMSAVISVLNSVVSVIHEALSYMNPFARHSPSLVEQVQDGVAVIGDHYGTLTDTGGVYDQAVGAHQDFLNATGDDSGKRALSDRTVAKQTSELSKNDPGALPAYQAQIAAMRALAAEMEKVDAAYRTQSQVVDNWKAALDSANAKIKSADEALASLKLAASLTSEALQDAKNHLNTLAATDITGMHAMSDQIFANEMAQKNLRLELLKVEDSGQSIDSVTKKMADLQGVIELTRGRANSLHVQGAGSDITGGLTDYASSLTSQRNAMMSGSSGGGQAAALMAELTRLQRKGEELTLQNSIMFDPLIRQLRLARTGVQEMPYDKLLADTVATKGQVDTLTASYDAQNEVIKRQQAAVDAMKVSRDAIQQTYTNEKAKLDELKAAYSAMNSLFNQMASSAAGAASKGPKDKPLDQTMQNFNNGALGFEVPAVDTSNLKNAGLDIKKLMDEWKKNMPKFDFNPFSGFMDNLHNFIDNLKRGMDILRDPKIVAGAWADFKTNFKRGLDTAIPQITDWFETSGFHAGLNRIGEAFHHVFLEDIPNLVHDGLNRTGEAFRHVFLEDIPDIAIAGFDALKNNIVHSWDENYTNFKKGMDRIGTAVNTWFDDQWRDFKKGLDRIGTSISTSWDDNYADFKKGMDRIGSAVNTWFDDQWRDFKKGLDRIGETISGAWTNFSTRVVTGFERIKGDVGGALTSVGGLFSTAWTTISEGVTSGLGGIGTAIGNIWGDIENTIRTGINNVIGFFNDMIHSIDTLLDKIGVGHIPDIPLIGGGPGSQGGGGGQVHQSAAGNNLGLLSRVGPGFITNGAMSIVGEGHPAHPEFVIPTDPTHRNNATRLYAELGGMLGMPQMAGGGVLGWIQGAAGSAADAAGAVGNWVRGAALDGIKDVIEGGLNVVPGGMLRDISKGLVEEIFSGLAGKNKAASTFQQAGSSDASQQEIEKIILDVAGSLGANYKVALSAIETGFVESGMTNLNNGDLDSLGVFQQRPSQGWGTPDAGPEGVMNIGHAAYSYLTRAMGSRFAGDVGTAGNLAQDVQRSNYPDRYDEWQDAATAVLEMFHYGRAPQGHPKVMASGGKLPFNLFDSGGMLPTGLSLAMNMTGKPETVLPPGAGGTTVVINGNLEFPNINAPADAKLFIQNLKALT